MEVPAALENFCTLCDLKLTTNDERWRHEMRDHRSLRYILPRFRNPWASFVLTDQDGSRNRVEIEVRTDTFMEEAE